MKELSIEEKAKRYDKALEIIKAYYNRTQFSSISDSREEIKTIEKAFPELRESKDERTRKYIINHLQEHLKTVREFLNNGMSAPFSSEEIKMLEESVVWLKRQGEQKPTEWEPQTGDIFRKKGTTSPTYHLCDKREDGITFGFVENREVGISGGEITIFALRQDYELVERPKSIEDVVEEELNKGLQTKVGQNSWSEEDKKILQAIWHSIDNECLDKNGVDTGTAFHWLESIKFRIQPQQEWSEEDIRLLDNCIGLIEDIDCTKEEQNWLKSLKDRVLPQNLTITDEELAQAKKDAYNDAIDKIEYHSGEPTFDDGWSAAIWYLKKRNVQPQLQWKLNDEQIKKDLNKAAKEWDCKASFSPIAMVMDGDRPIGTKQHITSHADSFKAGVDWIIKKLKG